MAVQNENKRILCIRGILHSKILPDLLRILGIGFETFLRFDPYVLSFEEEAIVGLIHRQAIRDEDIVCIQISKDLEGGDPSYSKKERIQEQVASMTKSEVERYLDSVRAGQRRSSHHESTAGLFSSSLD